MKKFLKKVYYSCLEKHVYKREIRELGLSFSEYSEYVNSIIGRDDIVNDTLLFDKKIKKITNYCYVQCIMEIFKDEVYRFDTNSKAPYIIDCGANMGLSIIYFKRLYPNAKIIAFEADPNIYELCRYNIEQFQFKDVEIINAAVWTSEGTMSFRANDSLGGKLENSIEYSTQSVSVKTLTLLPYLAETVDFLKIDIEGAEVDVLLHSKEALSNVRTMFVEYHSTVGEKQRLDELLSVLKDADFRYYIKEAYPVMHHPFLNHHNKEKFTDGVFDLQLNIFAYRE